MNKEIEKLNLNEENIQKIRKWEEYLKRGSYGNSKDITDTYNEVYKETRSKANYTNCGGCLRSRINSMVSSLNEWEKYQESLKPRIEEPVPTAGTTVNNIVEVVTETKPKKQTKTKQKDAKE